MYAFLYKYTVYIYIYIYIYTMLPLLLTFLVSICLQCHRFITFLYQLQFGIHFFIFLYMTINIFCLLLYLLFVWHVFFSDSYQKSLLPLFYFYMYIDFHFCNFFFIFTAMHIFCFFLTLFFFVYPSNNSIFYYYMYCISDKYCFSGSYPKSLLLFFSFFVYFEFHFCSFRIL